MPQQGKRGFQAHVVFAGAIFRGGVNGPWFNEGAAEFFSTFQAGGDTAAAGDASVERLSQLNTATVFGSRAQSRMARTSSELPRLPLLAGYPSYPCNPRPNFQVRNFLGHDFS